ncbi:MoxR family ATPase [Flavobacterium zepuense]|uniref:MoxR family ATPase n=1 Tax=Flavobacterium zepuense TaxID=2593302 RepID=A0A552VAC8_9FLAO|nr:MoxR family ATPase [Flavobacterium zepuense]TRW27435.1 MoxR family ATPase [Flavobacterium zepuense]
MTEFENINPEENQPDNINLEKSTPQDITPVTAPEPESDNINFSARLDLDGLRQTIDKVKQELSSVIVGQHKMIDQLLVAILSNGHVLLEGVPGVAKTITAKLLSKTLTLDFSRIQFTPDLMPSDILGTSVFDLSKSQFTFKKGPIFSNFVLIDEINRAPAKTQAALFEVMEERQITVEGTTHAMEAPFLVIATQNPIEQEGTYRLPEAQLDRFLFKITIDYPKLDEEIAILQRENALQDRAKLDNIKQVLSQADIIKYQGMVKQILVEPQLIEYIAKLVTNTRENAFLYLGASPRASIAILNAAKGYAALRGRDFVTPDDIKDSAIPVLRHRVMVAPEREMEGLTSEQIIKQIIDTVEIPR